MMHLQLISKHRLNYNKCVLDNVAEMLSNTFQHFIIYFFVIFPLSLSHKLQQMTHAIT